MELTLVKNSRWAKKAKTSWFWMVGTLLLFLIVFQSNVNAQEETQLRLVAVDTTAFPTVSVTLLSADSRSAPADLSDLALRENGAPITDLNFTRVPSGVDVTFVLDANLGFNEIDGDIGPTRREKTLASIHHFSEQYMNPDGLDSVSIVVPGEDGQSGRFLISEATTAEAIDEAINNYDPEPLRPTPLNAMIALALEQAQQRKDDGRYQAILLFTDGRRLDQQLSFPQLVAQANDANVPVFSAILGESADPNEIANVSRLSDPTRAFYVHLTETELTDPIYQIWQDQSNPVRVQYRSHQRQSGRNQLTINLGSALISAEFEVMLVAPEVDLSLDATQILRAGVAPDTPLDALQPTIQPVSVRIKWPDGLPRQLTDLTFLVDGQPEKTPAGWQDSIQDQIELNWDISQLEEGSIDLAVRVVDELGYQGESDPVIVDIAINRPLPPTPAPTTVPPTAVQEVTPDSRLRWDLLAGAAILLFLVLIVIIWRRRKALAKDARSENEQERIEDPNMHTADGVVLIASLESLADSQTESFTVRGENVAIGSQAQNVQIVLEDGSVSRLHARIRRQDQEYWLFDEGGSDGTYLNYERLGLAPQKLSDGDVVQFGKVAFRFRLRQFIELERK